MKNKKIIYTLFSIFLLTPIGFYFKFYYKGFAKHWAKNSLVDVLYVIFWTLVVFLFFNNLKTWKIIIAVLSAICIIEISQLLNHPILETIRNNFLGLTLLGNCFSWKDFLYYLTGSIIAWLWLEILKGIE